MTKKKAKKEDKLVGTPSIVNEIWCDPKCTFMVRDGGKREPLRCGKLKGRVLGWRNGILAACVEKVE